MKKMLSIVLFAILVATLLLLVLFKQNSRSKLQAKLDANCQNLPSSDFASERVHGIILRDNAIATVRLEGEKNFSPPGGHIDTGESTFQALQRELKEEIGITVSEKDVSSFKTYCEVLGATKTQRTHTYILNKWDGILKVKQKDQLKWANYEYRLDANADTELVKLLELLYSNKLLRS